MGCGDIGQRLAVLVDALALGSYQRNVWITAEAVEHPFHAFELQQVVVVEKLDEFAARLFQAKDMV
ncbi:hypothetical protein D3C81_1854150 [compost metagenome]